MAKRIDCGSGCFLARKGCKDIRDCACACGPLKAINSNLFDGCVDQCNSGSPPNGTNDYMCSHVGGEVLFNNFGLIECGYDPHQSAQYIAYEEQFQNEVETSQGSQLIGRSILLGLGLLIVAGFLSIIIK